MSSIMTVIQLQDRMSKPLMSITNAMLEALYMTFGL